MNQLFKSLYDTVVINTNRPHMAKEIKEAIKAATIEYHNRGRFRADVRDVILTSTNGGSTQYKFNIPQEKRIREILNICPVSISGLKGINLKLKDLFDEPHCASWYSWYNETLTINVAHPANTFQMTFLSFPAVDEANYDSWVARKYPHYITDSATFRILVMANQMNQAGVYKGLVGEVRIPGTHIFNLFQDNSEVR